MKAKVARWGNSLALRLPAQIVRDFGLREGEVLDITANKPKIEITAPERERRYVNGIPVYTLEELVADMDRLGPDACPQTLDWGPDRGSEIIDDEYSRGELILEDLIGKPDEPR